MAVFKVKRSIVFKSSLFVQKLSLSLYFHQVLCDLFLSIFCLTDLVFLSLEAVAWDRYSNLLYEFARMVMVRVREESKYQDII